MAREGLLDFEEWLRKARQLPTPDAVSQGVRVDVAAISNVHVVTADELLGQMTVEELQAYDDMVIEAIYATYPAKGTTHGA